LNYLIKTLQLLLIIILVACEKQEQWIVEVPAFGELTEISGLTPISDSVARASEGVFKVNAGSEIFGDTIVLKQTRDKISLFSNKNGTYIIADAGQLDNEIIAEGYWRDALDEKTGLIRLQINYFLPMPDSFDITGLYSNDNSTSLYHNIRFTRVKKLNYLHANNDFQILAHRGGGSTADKLPYSENSIELINYSEYFGCTGIEIDVQLTKDKIPILYHDDDLNLRLIQKGPLMGNISSYSYKQLKMFVTLLHGETIPQLSDALEHVVNNTTLKFVWLDIKSHEAFEKSFQIVKQTNTLAKAKGRKLDIYMAINSNEESQTAKQHDLLSICELGSLEVKEFGTSIWAYPWSLGFLDSEISDLHNAGIKTIVWTLNDPEFINKYINHGRNNPAIRFDGILTNRPTILAYYYYTMYAEKDSTPDIQIVPNLGYHRNINCSQSTVE
jgi:glycerophosphoryl diester phosphodiesterase